MDFVATQARQRIASARQSLTALGREGELGISQTATFNDPMLSADGLAAKRTELRDQAREQFSASLRQFRATVDQDVRILRNTLNEHRPKVSHDAASLVRSQVKWDQVRMRLEGGIPMSRIIATADLDTALAIREWAPAWLEAQNYQARTPGLGEVPEMPDSTALLNSIDDRLATVTASAFRDALAAAREAEREWAGLEPMLQHHEYVAAGIASDGLAASIRASHAREDAGRLWVDPEPADESVDAAL